MSPSYANNNNKLSNNLNFFYNRLLYSKKEFLTQNAFKPKDIESKSASKIKANKKEFPLIPTSKSVSPINLNKVTNGAYNRKAARNYEIPSPSYHHKLEEKIYGLVMINKNKNKFKCNNQLQTHLDSNNINATNNFMKYNNNNNNTNNSSNNNNKKLNISDNTNINTNLSFNNNDISNINNTSKDNCLTQNYYGDINSSTSNHHNESNFMFVKTKKLPMLTGFNKTIYKKQDITTTAKSFIKNKKHIQYDLDEISPTLSQKKTETNQPQKENDIHNLSFGDNNNVTHSLIENASKQLKQNYTKLIKHKLSSNLKASKVKCNNCPTNIFNHIVPSLSINTNNNIVEYISKNKQFHNKPQKQSLTSMNSINNNNLPLKTRTKTKKDIQNSLFFNSTIETTSTSNFKRKKTNSQNKNQKPPLLLDISSLKSQHPTLINKSIDFNSTFNIKKPIRINSFKRIEDISNEDISKTPNNQLQKHISMNNNNTNFIYIPVKNAFSYTNILDSKRNSRTNNYTKHYYTDINYISDNSPHANNNNNYTPNNLNTNNSNNKSWTSLFVSPQKTRNNENVPLKSNDECNNTTLSIKILSTKQNKVPSVIQINKIKLFDAKGNNVPISFIVFNNNIVNIKHNRSKIKVGVSNKGEIIKLYYNKSNSYNDVKSVFIENDNVKGINEIEIYKDDNILLWKGNLSSQKNNIHFNNTSIELFSDESEENLIETINKNNLNIEIPNNNNYKLINITKTKQQKLPLLQKSHTNANNTKNQKQNIKKLFKTIHSLKNASSHNISQRKGELPHIKCQSIIIKILSNYGHKHQVGLTGIILIDKNGDHINIPHSLTSNSNLKHLHIYSTERDYLSVDNLFTTQNMTIYQKHMWITNIKDNPPSICLNFLKKITLSEIKIYNYNNPQYLDKCAKEISIIFDNQTEPIDIYLHKGIGSTIVDYSQSIKFPFVPFNYTLDELEPFKQIKYASMLYDQKFETPYLPSGFIYKIALIESWGGSQTEYIALDKVVFYDQLGRKRTDYKSNIMNHKLLDNNNNNALYFEKFKNYKKCQNNHIDTDMNDIYFIFDNIISVSQIKIFNYTQNINQSIKRVIIHCDDKMIFNGEVNKYSRLNQGITSILFTCDLNVTKDVKECELPGFNERDFKEELDQYLFTSQSMSDSIRV